MEYKSGFYRRTGDLGTLARVHGNTARVGTTSLSTQRQKNNATEVLSSDELHADGHHGDVRYSQ
jgi:hypothetical protein